MLQHGGLLSLLCLSGCRVVYYGQTLQDRAIVYNEVEQECGNEISIGTMFDPIQVETGVELGGHNLTFELRPNGGIKSKTLSWEVLGSRGWAFDRSESQPTNTRLTHKIGDLKTPPLNYGQTVANGAKLWINRRCKVIVVANPPKIFSWFALEFAG